MGYNGGIDAAASPSSLNGFQLSFKHGLEVKIYNVKMHRAI